MMERVTAKDPKKVAAGRAGAAARKAKKLEKLREAKKSYHQEAPLNNKEIEKTDRQRVEPKNSWTPWILFAGGSACLAGAVAFIYLRKQEASSSGRAKTKTTLTMSADPTSMPRQQPHKKPIGEKPDPFYYME